ncbi:MAG: PAS domain-containing protein [Proteobacteria bacterium]|nr:PAS domain-containing protein [Pseudomonadota bacterium]
MPDFAPTIRRDAIASVRPRALFDWWDTRRGARALPTRRDFFAEELVSWWPDLVFYDVERDGGASRFRFRVHGDNAAVADGGNFTGRFLDEVLPPESANQILHCYAAVLSTKLPLYSRSHRFSRDGHNIGFERLLLPFGDGEVQQVLAYLVRVANLRADPTEGHLAGLRENYINDILAFVAP